MLFLFCDDLDSPAQSPAAERFFTLKAPKSLINERANAEKELERILSNRRLMLLIRAIIAYIVFMFGWAILGVFVKSDVSMREAYQIAPWLFWLCGLCLAAGGTLALTVWIRRRRINDMEDVRTARERVDAIEKSIREYLHVSDDAVKADILTCSYRYEFGKMAISGSASNCEVCLYKQDHAVCIYDGSSVFTIPQEEMTGIRLLRQAIPVTKWNKSDLPSGKQYKNSGVMPYEKSLKGLRFYCALDLFHAGELYSLLFPAYELSSMQELTGLSVPDLPDTSAAGQFRQEIQEEDWQQNEEKLRPKFYWLPPKGIVKFWFTPQSDAEFQAKHPILFKILLTLGVIVVFAPAVFFCIVALRESGIEFRDMLDAEFNGWLLIVFFGGLIVGFGFFNFVAAWMHQYLGHFMTIAFFLVGLLLVGTGISLMQL